MENVIYIFAYNFANVGMKPVYKGWNIFVHLYKKSLKIWWTRRGIREFGVSYRWGLSIRYSCFIRKPWLFLDLIKQRGIQIWFPLIKSCLKYIITFRWFETTIFVLKYILNSYVITVSILYQKSYETPKVLSKPKQILIRCRTSWIIF